MLINNDTYQRETLSEQLIQQPLNIIFMSTIASSWSCKIDFRKSKLISNWKKQSLHTLCNMINALFNQNYQKIDIYFFVKKYIILIQLHNSI